MPNIAVFGGNSYLASIIKNQSNLKSNKYIFFSREKSSENNIYNLLKKKNQKNLKKFDVIIHLIGPNQKQLSKNINLIKRKNKITSKICDLCMKNSIKLIYISSMQIYKNYGKSNISINSKKNNINPYSKSHCESEKIIFKKFSNQKKMFTILRMCNVFGFKDFNNKRDINSNLIHSLCNMALKNKKIILNDGSIKRSFIPSKIFVTLINSIIKNNLFQNSISNIFYKNFDLNDVAKIIKKRCKVIFDLNIDIVIKKYSLKRNFFIYSNKKFKLTPSKKLINKEIDQILFSIKKLIA